MGVELIYYVHVDSNRTVPQTHPFISMPLAAELYYSTIDLSIHIRFCVDSSQAVLVT